MKPTIYLFADYSSIALALLNRFMSQGFACVVVANNPKLWQAVPITSQSRIISKVDYVPVPHSHSLYIDIVGKSFIPLLLSGALTTDGKAIVITSLSAPFVSNKDEVAKLLSLTGSPRLCIIGEVLEPLSPSPLSVMIRELVQKQTLSVPEGNPIVFPVLVEEIANRIERALFSYGSEKLFFLAHSLPLARWLEELHAYIPILEVKHASKISLPPPPPFELPTLGGLPNDYLTQILAAVPKTASAKTVPVKKVSLPRLGVTLPKSKLSKSRVAKKIPMALLIIVWLLLLPFLPLALSVGAYYGAYKSFASGNDHNLSGLLTVGEKSAQVSVFFLGLYEKVPGLGLIYRSPYVASQILETGASIATDALAVRTESNILIQGILGNTPYDVQKTSELLTRDLSSLYTKLSFLETTLKEALPSINLMVPEIEKLPTLRQTLSGLKDVARTLPLLLGREGLVTYMVLLQNNMELRPTGGFIGSFALISFENGKLIDTNVYDVYDADGQLKGFVKPPDPIVKHLGEASWFLRDANWDPDFASSAERVEWFLDKTLERPVDGVVAIDLEVAKTILTATGSVKLTDFDDEITADNMYEKVQYEVEKEFFPGSRKKTNYLTALAKALIEQTKNVPPKAYKELGQGLWQNILARDVQIVVDNKDAQEGLRVLGWTGEMPRSTCTNCLSFPVGVVEANMGVNKANYHVTRNATLKLGVGQANIQSSLNLELKNTSTQVDREIEHRYKSYIRVLAPHGSTIQSVTLASLGAEKTLVPDIEVLDDRVEVGVLVEVLPGQTKTLKVQWSTPSSFTFRPNESLEVIWRKQAGVAPHPILMSYTFPSHLSVSSEPPVTLTVQGNLSYNTTLSRDIVHTLSW